MLAASLPACRRGAMKVRRVVTCHSAEGKSIAGMDGPPPHCISRDESQRRLGTDEQGDIRAAFFRVLNENNVRRFTSAKIVEITDKGVLLEENGTTTLYPCDTVILAFGYRKNDAIVAALAGLVAKVVVVGDSSKVGRVFRSDAERFWGRPRSMKCGRRCPGLGEHARAVPVLVCPAHPTLAAQEQRVEGGAPADTSFREPP